MPSAPNCGLRIGVAGLAAAALLLSAAAGAQATVYRWVDKDGHVHYGDQPAANAQQVSPNSLDGHGDSGSSSGAAGADDAAKQLAECKRKSDDLARFQNAITITETDALGNNHEYTAEQKEQLVAKTRQYVADHCAGLAPPAAAPAS